jgi:hypothetical protein
MLLELEEAQKRSEAAKKAAETRKKNRLKREKEESSDDEPKSKPEPKPEAKSEQSSDEQAEEEDDRVDERMELEVGVYNHGTNKQLLKDDIYHDDNIEEAMAEAESSMDESVQLQNKEEDGIEEAEIVEEEESENELLDKVPEEIKAVAEASDNIHIVHLEKPKKETPPEKEDEAPVATLEEAFGPTDEEVEQAQSKLNEIADQVKSSQKQAAIEIEIPKFTEQGPMIVANMLKDKNFAGCAMGGSLLISTNDTDGFIAKMADYSAAEDVYQLNLFKNLMDWYDPITMNDIANTDFDVALVSAPPSMQFNLGLDILKNLKEHGQLYFVYALNPKGGIDALPNHGEFFAKLDEFKFTKGDNGKIGLIHVTNE